MSVTGNASHHEPPAREFLSFRVGGEEYGIDLLSVQEIRGFESCTQLANSPEHVKGMINLRGIIVPIIDLRVKFGIAAPVYDAMTVVIILNLAGHTVGIVVDSVKDVIALVSTEIRPAPDVGSSIDTDALLGIGTVEQGMVILLDIERVLAGIGMGGTERLAA